MALFLQESVDEDIEVYESIEEAYEGLIQASLDMQDLTESLLREDFLLNEECKVLSEAVVTQKKDNFLVSAVKRIIEFINSVRKKIIGFFTKLASGLGVFWDRLTKQQKASNVEVVAGGLASAVTLMTLIKQMVGVREQPAHTINSKMNALTAQFNTAVAKARNTLAINKKNNKVETKSTSALDPYLNPVHTMKVFLSGKAKLNKAEALAKEAESTNDSKKANSAKDITRSEIKIAAAMGKMTSFVKSSVGKVKNMAKDSSSMDDAKQIVKDLNDPKVKTINF